MLNSFVANYLVRTRVTTHVTATIIDRLVVPRPEDEPAVQEIASLATTLSRAYVPDAAARLQALCARTYALTSDEFEHILSTFPLVPADERRAAASAFRYSLNSPCQLRVRHRSAKVHRLPRCTIACKAEHQIPSA